MMPFGLTNARSTFQALRNDVFRDYVGKFMLVYLDDVLIFSRSAEEHKEHAELVLKHMWDKKLFTKLSKCEFNKPSVTFLGHVEGQERFSREGRRWNVFYCGRVRQQSSRSSRFWDLPTIIVVSSKAFIRLRRQSLISLVRRMPFCGARNTTRPCSLKHAFTTTPVLKIPDPTKPYIVKTDASMPGIGALLEHEEEDGWHPVAFKSRNLQPAEENYPVYDLELMAIVYVLH
jgi:hypothetical protein